MFRKYILPGIAILGALIALLVVFWSQREVPTPPICFPPPTSPYEYAIAGSGIIEASGQNISIGTPFNEVVTNIYVVEGDFVKAGDLLFELDPRAFEPEVEVAGAQLRQSQAVLADKRTQFSFYERLYDSRAVSEQSYAASYYAVIEAEEAVRVAEANLYEAEMNFERSVIRSPIDGEILQVSIHVGEIALISPFTSTQALSRSIQYGNLIYMGTVNPLQVRIDIDEDDAWRFIAGSRATAFVRGNSTINFPLKFLRIEPYIIPKSSFTGDTTERVDTRVLQVLYNFEKNDLPVYTGQVLDIYIESGPIQCYVS